MNGFSLRGAAAILSFLLLFSPSMLFAGVHTWKGGSGQNHWSDDENWIEGESPDDDDNAPVVLVFPASAQSFTTVCDLDYFYVNKMIFRGSYTVKHTGEQLSGHPFGLSAGTGEKLVIDSAASPSVVFDASTSFIFVGAINGNGSIRLQSGTLRMQGHFNCDIENIHTLEGNGTLWLECQEGAGGNLTVNGGTLYLASHPGLYDAPFILTVDANGALRTTEDDQLKGSPVTINGGWMNIGPGASDTVGALTLRDGASVTAGNAGAALNLGGKVTCAGGDCEMEGHFLLSGVTREFNVADGGDLLLRGYFDDGENPEPGFPSSGGIRKTGPGEIDLDYDGYFYGPVLLEAGPVWMLRDGATGMPGGGVSVSQDARLIFSGRHFTGDTLTLAGSLIVNPGESNWGGNVVLQSNVQPLNIQNNSSLEISGVVSGSSTLATIGPGILELSGNGANTYTGGTLVRGGTVRLSKTSGNAIPGNMQIDSTVTGLSAKVELTYDNQIADSSLVQMRAMAVLDLASHSDTIGGLMSFGSGEPEVRMGSSRTVIANFTVGANNQSTSFYGRITGSDSMTLQKTGTGILTLGIATAFGFNTYAGATRVLGGVLEVKSPQLIGNASVNTNAYLTGTGTTGVITLNGGNLRAEHLTTGNVGANLSGGKFLADLLGAAPVPDGYDQMHVKGTVTLTNTSFLGGLPQAFEPQAGARFVIIENDGADAVTGQFTGLPEGGNVSISGKPFSISYHGGDGNDVELKYLGAGGKPRILTIGYNRALDKVHLEALAPPGVLCYWQVSATTGGWSNFASGVPDAAGLLKLDQPVGLHADRLFFRLVQP